ncbi:MAG: hypothetical protein IJ498_02810 [Akkermansia sp.]|nr:hypothetical protein [Akkermansia sp.]
MLITTPARRAALFEMRKSYFLNSLRGGRCRWWKQATAPNRPRPAGTPIPYHNNDRPATRCVLYVHYVLYVH